MIDINGAYRWMKRKIFTAIAVLVMMVGIAVMLYPLVSNLLYERQQEELTEFYADKAEEVPEEEKNEQLEECRIYNGNLRSGGVLLTDPFEGAQLDPAAHPYVDLLNITGDGAMGSLEIPAIGVDLVIYHGTDEEVLQKGVGHLQGSSLPIGGTGTHSVLSAHTGLSSKKLFTDLDQLEEGDVFYIHVLNEDLAYQVDQIKVVLPSDTEDLQINAEEDYVTLITCTPYGINSHRLLVRGTRVPYDEAKASEERAGKDTAGSWLQDYGKAMIAGLILLAVLGLIAFCIYKRRQNTSETGKRKRKRHYRYRQHRHRRKRKR